MPGPIDSLLFVHAAIVEEVARIERTVTVATDGEALRACGDDLAWFEELMGYHTGGEEIGLFPAIVEKSTGLDLAYLLDHEIERELFETLRAAVGGGDQEAAKRTAAALAHHVGTHVRKENELILPFVHEHFSPEEQGAIVGKIIGAIPKEKMARAVPWIVARLDPDMAEKYVRAIQGAMPPPVFSMMVGAIADGVPAERWEDLQRRIDGLSRPS